MKFDGGPGGGNLAAAIEGADTIRGSAGAVFDSAGYLTAHRVGSAHKLAYAHLGITPPQRVSNELCGHSTCLHLGDTDAGGIVYYVNYLSLWSHCTPGVYARTGLRQNGCLGS